MVIWEIQKGNTQKKTFFFRLKFRIFIISFRISPLHVYACSLCIAGLSQLLIPLAIKHYKFLMPLMLFTGFLQSAQEVLMPILCIKFAGTQNFANAYGMLLLCQGISSLLGPPTLGKNQILHKTKNFLIYFSFVLF